MIEEQKKAVVASLNKLLDALSVERFKYNENLKSIEGAIQYIEMLKLDVDQLDEQNSRFKPFNIFQVVSSIPRAFSDLLGPWQTMPAVHQRALEASSLGGGYMRLYL